MSKIVAHMTMSLDGFIADPDDNVGPLFDWYTSGEVTVPANDPRWSFQLTEASAQLMRQMLSATGALICGRRLFDHTQGWGGNHPLAVPVFVVTHSVPEKWIEENPGAPFTFVTDGIESAVRQATQAAGEKVTTVASPTITQQCLDLGLLDEVSVSLAPVLLGQGIRFFDHLHHYPVMLDDPDVVVADRATHLTYRVRRPRQ